MSTSSSGATGDVKGAIYDKNFLCHYSTSTHDDEGRNSTTSAENTYAATLAETVEVNPNVATLSLATKAATVSAPTNVTPNVAALTLNTYAASTGAGDVIPTEPAADDRVGGAHAGYSGRGQRKKDRAAQDEQEFLEIIALAMPEIIKYLK